MKHGFVKVAAAVCDIKVADCGYNTANIISKMEQAANSGAKLVVFPELCITSASCADLFFQQALHSEVAASIEKILSSSKNFDTLFAIGAPVINKGLIYNCVLFICKGALLAVVPKSNLTSGEKRYFSAAPKSNTTVNICGTDVKFGSRIILQSSSVPSFSVAAELGYDMYAPVQPCVYTSGCGANIIVNCSAQYTLSDADHTATITELTKRLKCSYVFANAGYGESTTDYVYAGERIICENGAILSCSDSFENGITCSEIDTQTSGQIVYDSYEYDICDTVPFDIALEDTVLTRKYAPNPFIPEINKQDYFEKILQIQSNGLKKRVEHTHCKKLVLGISGGLDSCLALLVSVRALKLMDRPMTDILAVTMPCFGTTSRTKSNAQLLCELFGVDFECIDIAKSVNQHFEDIGQASDNYDVVFENSQARERTQILMDLANKHSGLVVGTGDLSELALGWATYSGDHMSMYGVNADVPKTLVRHLVRHEAEMYGNEHISDVLYDILDTPVSPELLPADNDSIAQKTEDLVGPYELHDFFLYYVLHYGFAPDKIYRIACHALGHTYDEETIKKWLKNFYRRFFTQQFKRSCLPDGPKVGKVGVSPRGDLVMPSDACSTLWMKIAEAL